MIVPQEKIDEAKRIYDGQAMEEIVEYLVGTPTPTHPLSGMRKIILFIVLVVIAIMEL